MKRWVSALTCAGVGLSGCGVNVGGEAMPTPSVGTSTSTVVLPFVPTIAERSNERNSGSSFEPCVAFSDTEMRSLGADPKTIKDAAMSDSPNYRGCHWQSFDGNGYFSQIVGDEKSTDDYKVKESERPWRPDQVIGGRTVIVTTDGNDGCFAAFMSKRAMVFSRYSNYETPSQELKVECDIAIKWATMAISKAP